MEEHVQIFQLNVKILLSYLFLVNWKQNASYVILVFIYLIMILVFNKQQFQTVYNFLLLKIDVWNVKQIIICIITSVIFNLLLAFV